MGTNLLVEEVYSVLKNRILSGEYLPGMHLIEAALKDEFAVSRVTMREALRRLVADELVNLVPNSGIWVRRLSYRDVVELHSVREALEGLAAKLAALAPDKNLDNLRKICAMGQEATENRDLLRHREMNNMFHKELVKISGNLTLVKTLERLDFQVRGHQLQFLPFLKDEDLEITQRDHEELVQAVSQGDGDRAESLMQQHMKSGLKFALSCFPPDAKEDQFPRVSWGELG